MTLDFALEVLVFNSLIPACVAAICYLAAKYGLPHALAGRYAAAVAVAAAFAVGYSLLPDWAPLKPAEYWHWLPYLAGLGAVLGAVTVADGVTRTEAWLVAALVALAAAWLLVPAWPDLAPLRLRYILLLAAYLWLTGGLLGLLAQRVSSRLLVALLALASGVTAAMTASYVSLKFGQLGIALTAALAGCWAALLVYRREIVSPALAIVYAILAGGVAWAGCINPQPPLWSLMVLPATPLILWLSAIGPLQRLSGVKLAAVQTALVLCLITLGCIWTALAAT